MMLNSVPSYSVSMELVVSRTESRSQMGHSGDCQGKDLLLRKRMTVDTTPLRWYALSLFCAAAFIQNIMWNTWSPIAASALYAFPSWRPSTVALLCNWGSITFLIFIVPSCWMLNRKGLRGSFITASILSTLGSGIRCLPLNEDLFTVSAHVGAILNAIGGVTLGPAVVLLSSTWFPPHQRTSATGIGTACSQLGVAGSYLIGPFIVSEPPKKDCAHEETRLRTLMRHQIQKLMIVCFVLELILLVLMVASFPEKPYLPPSKSSFVSLAFRKPPLKKALLLLFRNKDLWLLALAASLSCGIAGPWFSLLTVTFSRFNIPQSETARLGFWAVICSCCMGLIASKLSDVCQHQLKTILLLLLAFADFMFCWILFITTHVVPFVKSYLEGLVVAGLSFLWATPALFYEFGVELSYPVPEGLVAGSMMTLTNATACLVYFQLYIFPQDGVAWLNYALFTFGLLSFTALTCVEEKYNRLELDSNY